MTQNANQTVLDQAPIGYCLLQAIRQQTAPGDEAARLYDFQFLEANAAFERILGVPQADLIGRSVADLPSAPLDLDDRRANELGDVACQGGSCEFHQYSKKRQAWYHINVTGVGQDQLSIFLTDITGSVNQFDDKSLFFDTCANLLCINSLDGYFIRVNDAWQTVFGYTQQELEGKSIWDFLDPAEHQTNLNAAGKLRQQQSLQNLVNRFRCKDGTYRLVEWTAHRDHERIYCIARDVLESQEQLHLTLLSVADGVITTDADGKIELINPVAELLTGWSQAEAIGRPLHEVCRVMNLETGEFVIDMVQKTMITRKATRIENHHVLVARDQSKRAIEHSAAPIIDRQGDFKGLVLVFRDITERDERLRQIEYLSFHDILTGLYNRRFLEEEIKRLDTARNLPISIIMGDINQLKLVNDAFGHRKGDELIIKAAEAIRRGCRTEDLAARWGGDEFLVYLPKTQEFEAENIVTRIQALCAVEQVNNIDVSISFGISTKVAKEEDIAKTMQAAENAMYRQKNMNARGVRGDILRTITNTFYHREPDEEAHAKLVSELCKQTAQALGYNAYEISKLALGGLMHDIGKIAINVEILDKPGPLTDEEWKEMRQHAEIGYKVISSIQDMTEVGKAILAHHERWDGNGYPMGLKWSEIPLDARIIALADTYATMVSHHAYKPSVSKDEAIAEIRRNAGTQFDPEIAELFIEKVIMKESA